MTDTTTRPPAATAASLAAAVQRKRGSVVARICSAIEDLPAHATQDDLNAVSRMAKDEINAWADNICGSLARLPQTHLDAEAVMTQLEEILDAVRSS